LKLGYFGTNPTIINFARELIEAGHKKAAKELNRAVVVLGSADDSGLMARIRGKFVVFQKTAEGESLTPAATSVLREAVALGYVLSVDKKNMFTLAKGTAESYLRSNEDILRFGQIMRPSKG
jgi:hypothetical protein